MRQRLPQIVMLAALGFGGLVCAPVCAQAVTLEPVEIATPDGLARGLLATVQLDDPRVEIVVTGPLSEGGASACVGVAEAAGRPTDEWMVDTGVALAINANFFGRVGSEGCQDVIGLSVSDGVVVSKPRVFEGLADPAIVFCADGLGAVLRPGPADLAGVHDAVAGVGASPSSAVAGSLLVTDGRNTGATSRVEPDRRHPRTAAGVSADGRRLLLVAIDGRRPGWSVGVTLPELGDLLIARGVDDAVNLDGGGSTSLLCVDPLSGGVHANRPSDGAFRPVANHLGVRERTPMQGGSEVTDSGPERAGPFFAFVGDQEALEGFRIEIEEKEK